MIPKFRAWDERAGLTEVISIDLLEKKLKVSHWEYGVSNYFPLDDVELMQSTGLKDKNGVEIFEGDICKIQRIPSGMKPIFVVSDYIKEKLIFSKITILGQNSYEEQGGYTGNFLEVIGNRFENPELLNLR